MNSGNRLLAEGTEVTYAELEIKLQKDRGEVLVATWLHYNTGNTNVRTGVDEASFEMIVNGIGPELRWFASASPTQFYYDYN